MIPKMIEAGTDIFRLNCSHRRGGDFERVYPLIRKTAKEMGKKASGFLVPKRVSSFYHSVDSTLHWQHCCRSYTVYIVSMWIIATSQQEGRAFVPQTSQTA